MPTPNAVYNYLQANRDRYVEELKTLLRYPSVSTQSHHKKDVRDCASWLAEHLHGIGMEAEVLMTAGHPVVLASWLKAAGKPTVLVYGHYDVQPAEPFHLWTSPPFEPDIRDGFIYARGSTDDKGQMFTHVKSAEAWLKTVGELPVNLVFLIEGEEEIGSPNLEKFIREHKTQLGCDYVVISDTSQYAPGIPAITIGLRGIVCYGIHFKGAKGDLHSGSFGGAVPNPLHAATDVLAKMHDDKGRVTIPGFYDDVLPLEEWERNMIASLPFDEKQYKSELGLSALYGEEGYSTLERTGARPTLEINGLGGGYYGEGFKTVLPCEATAKVSMRLVANQDPKKIADAFVKFVSDNVMPGIEVTFQPEHTGKPALVNPHSPGMQAARQAIEVGFGKAPVLLREGGSIPVVSTFDELLGVDSLLLGWGQHDDGAHAPNERFNLEDYQKGIVSSAALWGELAKIDV